MKNFFPIDDDSMMKKFIKDDADFGNRKRDFQALLYMILTDADLTQRQFQDALQTTIFTRNYLKNFRWPNQW